MSKNKFTPGPWRISGKQTIVGQYGTVAKTFWKNGENDAHLICAAPDLYAVLAEAVEDPAIMETGAWDRRVLAALAKAEGRS